MADQTSSSGQGTSVNTEALDKSTDLLETIAGRLSSMGQDLQYTLEQLGTPWGIDKTGDKFLEQYKEPAAAVIDALLGSGSVLRDANQQVHDLSIVLSKVEALALSKGLTLTSGGTVDVGSAGSGSGSGSDSGAGGVSGGSSGTGGSGGSGGTHTSSGGPRG